jgi:hypothetical protein
MMSGAAEECAADSERSRCFCLVDTLVKTVPPKKWIAGSKRLDQTIKKTMLQCGYRDLHAAPAKKP